MRLRKLLVPMDFTAVSINALRYAIDFCSDCEITALHVRSGMLSTNEPVGISAGKTVFEFWGDAMTHFICKELKMEQLPKNLRVAVHQGSVVPTIVDAAGGDGFTHIIMGTRDKYSFFDNLLGTITLGVVKTSSLPVYVIPKYAVYAPFKKTVVGSDFHLQDASLVSKIAEWNKSYHAHIDFIHVSKGAEKDPEFHQEKEIIVRELFEKRNPGYAFNVNVLTDSDVSHSLLAKAYNAKAELLIVLPEKQNFVNSLFFKSVTKDLILRSDLPILFIK